MESRFHPRFFSSKAKCLLLPHDASLTGSTIVHTEKLYSWKKMCTCLCTHTMGSQRVRHNWAKSTSAQFSPSIMSDSLQPRGLQHIRPPCPSPTPRVYSNSSFELVMPTNHIFLCRPLVLLPSVFPSIRVFSNESVLHIRWPKYWSFSFSIRPSSEYSGLISFRMDWLDLLSVQGTLKSLLQHHSSKASILWHSAFFTNTYLLLGQWVSEQQNWKVWMCHSAD